MEISKKALIAGHIMKWLTVAFMAFDGIGKLMKIQPVVDAFKQLNYPLELASIIGAVALVATILYAIPKTSVLGAILLTGFLGGAVELNLREGANLFGNVLFPVYMGIILWGALYLLDLRIRALIPCNKNVQANNA